MLTPGQIRTELKMIKKKQNLFSINDFYYFIKL